MKTTYDSKRIEQGLASWLGNRSSSLNKSGDIGYK